MNQAQAARALVAGKWRLVMPLSSGLAFDYLARLAIFSVLPLIRKDLAVSEVALGLIASPFLWTYGTLSPVAGMVVFDFPACEERDVIWNCTWKSSELRVIFRKTKVGREQRSRSVAEKWHI